MLTAQDFLAELQQRGALRLSRVHLRENRSVVWSLTQQATVLNVHAAYRAAPPELLDAFAIVAREGGVSSAATRRAASVISAWPDVWRAIEATRASRQLRSVTSCCATSEQRRYLRALYRYFNLTRFDGKLPDDIPVRLSGRMKSSLGHMVPIEDANGIREVEEIALNLDLMLERNGAERIDTLLHEMAHVADFLESGHRGHGPSWRRWACRVGCRPERLYDRPVAHRRRRRDPVQRVPLLPDALACLAV
ncbi:MAG: SprT-like domain-containing protein [Gemmatimonadota bacterium]|nr:SprT-like domain-containing protein [Gemmatimonadota bacterium]MDH3421403.1 SprT-like domain-containing protein [Gemmatimonadota bacterium]